MRLDQRGAKRLEEQPLSVMGTPGDLADQPVRDSGGDFARHQLVLPLVPPTDDDVVTLRHLGEEMLDIRRIVLQIPVHGHENLSARVLDPGRHGGRLP